MARKKMSGETKAFSEALDYLQNSGLVTEATDNPAKFKEALDLIRKENPNHPILDRVKGILQELGLWDQFAPADGKPEDNASSKSSTASESESASASASAENEAEPEENSEGQQGADSETNSSEKIRPEAIMADYTYEKYLADKENQFMADFISHIHMSAGKGEKIEFLSEKEKNENMELLFETTKLGVWAQFNVDTDLQTEYLSAKDPKKYTEDLIADSFAGEVVTVAAAERMQIPAEEEQAYSEKGYSEYIKAQKERALDVIKNVFEGSGRIHVKAEHIWALTAATAVKAERVVEACRKNMQVYTQRARNASGAAKQKYEAAVKGFQKIAVDLSAQRQKVEAKATKVSKGVYKFFKGVLTNASDNAIQIGSNAVKTVALTVFLATPIAREATMVYAGLFFAGAWIHPFITEARRIKRENKGKGGEKLGFIKRLKMARRNIVPSNKEIAQAPEDKKRAMLNARRKYFVKAGVSTAAAGLLGGLSGYVAGLAGGAAGVKGAKVAVVATRLGASNTAQATGTAISAAQHAKYKDEASKAALKNDRIGLAVGLLSSGLTMFLMGDDGAEKLNAFFGKAKSFFSSADKAEHVAETINLSSGQGMNAQEVTQTEPVSDTLITETGTVENTDTAQADYTNVTTGTESEPVGLFPRAYSEDMGITKKQYNTLISTTEGTLMDENGDNVTLDRAYMNLTDDVMSRYFDGMTREQVLYRFNRVYAMTRFAVSTGNGTFRELVTDGPKFTMNNEEMEAMIKLLGCGEETEALYGAKEVFSKDNVEALMELGDRNTIFTGQNLKHCPNDAGAWRTISQKVAEQKVDAPVMPEITIDDIEEEDFVAPKVEMNLEDRPLHVELLDMPKKESYSVVDVSTNNSSEELTGGIKPSYEKDVTETRGGQNAINMVKNINGGR